MRRTPALAIVVAALALAAPVAIADQPSTPAAQAPRHYLLGGAVESIDPTPAQIAAGDFYLGGYGLGSGKVGNRVPTPVTIEPGRPATGILHDAAFPNGLADGVHVRAMVIGVGSPPRGAGGQAIALAQIETQGMFAAYKKGPFGLSDIRRDAAAAVAKLGGPAMGAGAILVDSNHTHAGPDTTGVWGGVPTAYMKYVHDQSVKAIVEAYQRMRPVDLYYGTSHAGVEGESKQYPSSDPLLTNQYSKDPVNQEVDDELRVLQARDDDGNVVATYLNYSSHPTVLGGDNQLVSADYTGPLSAMLSGLGGFGMEQVATLGRTQPARDNCPDRSLTGEAASACKINSYASRVFARAQEAIASATPLTGDPVVAMHSFYLQDPATNAPIVSLSYAGLLIGAPIERAATPPWFSANILGTTAFSGRIGDIVLSGGPGEMYPQIVQTVREAVPARGHINLGTAGDFLGYIIAPLEAYPEPLRRGFFDGDAPPTGNPDCTGGASPVALPSPIGCPDPVGNDNYFFNVSHTFGERLTCALLRGAGEVFSGDKTKYWSTYQLCPTFANDYALPADFDTTFPAQPDLSGLPTMDH